MKKLYKIRFTGESVIYFDKSDPASIDDYLDEITREISSDDLIYTLTEIKNENGLPHCWKGRAGDSPYGGEEFSVKEILERKPSKEIQTKISELRKQIKELEKQL